MTKLVTPAQMNSIDSLTINKMGIPGIVLMENAALKVVEEIIKMLGKPESKRLVIFAGKGNNGGDAFAVARHMHNKGAKVSVFLLSPPKDIKGDARINLDVLANMGIRTVEIKDKGELDGLGCDIGCADLIVDGILGTGIRGEVRGIIKGAIEAINKSGKRIISIDIPSGVDGESGKICGSAINAHKTVTFGFPKIGQLVHPGCDATGELIVADIGIPREVVAGLELKAELIDRKMAEAIVPQRCNNSNKGDYGKVFIVSGSVGMTGAGCLTAEASLRSGAGLVYLGVPSILSSIYDASLLEAVTIPLEDEDKGSLSRQSIPRILSRLKNAAVAAVGPGLTVDDEIVEIVGSIIESSTIPLVMDADALNAISKDVNVLKKRNSEIIITPHPGEMSRLAGISTEEVQNNRMEVAAEFSARWGVITVLKGYRTVIACPDGSTYINTTGNSGMATAGTGDVLTGIMAGLIGQGVKPREAAAAAVYIHGKAGDNAACKKGEHGMIAGDVVKEIPFVIKELAKKIGTVLQSS